MTLEKIKAFRKIVLKNENIIHSLKSECLSLSGDVEAVYPTTAELSMLLRRKFDVKNSQK
jgi:hypothetical protein